MAAVTIAREDTMWMRTGRLVPLVMFGIVVAACDRSKGDEDTAVAGPAVRVPVTTISQEARDHYLIGRDLIRRSRIWRRTRIW